MCRVIFLSVCLSLSLSVCLSLSLSLSPLHTPTRLSSPSLSSSLSLSHTLGSHYLGVGGTPLIFETVWQATKLVKSPDPGFDTLYDQWLAAFSKTYNGTLKPQYVKKRIIYY